MSGLTWTSLPTSPTIYTSTAFFLHIHFYSLSKHSTVPT
uniref:Uncharacterized protein n=1 Tax=Arundo donax TaxID=35708 RepID=A0A0A8Y1L0_ARUDO